MHGVRRGIRLRDVSQLVSSSLTSLFSTNMAISETKGCQSAAGNADRGRSSSASAPPLSALSRFLLTDIPRPYMPRRTQWSLAVESNSAWRTRGCEVCYPGLPCFGHSDYYISRESKNTRNVLWSRASVCLCVSVCLSVRGRMPTVLHGPGCNLGQW